MVPNAKGICWNFYLHYVGWANLYAPRLEASSSKVHGYPILILPFKYFFCMCMSSKIIVFMHISSYKNDWIFSCSSKNDRRLIIFTWTSGWNAWTSLVRNFRFFFLNWYNCLFLKGFICMLLTSLLLFLWSIKLYY